MRNLSLVGAVMVVLGRGASAQQGVVYQVDASSGLTEQFCLPPCLCPFREFAGGLSGTFRLMLDHQDPLFRYYTVTEVRWMSTLNGVPTAIVGSGTYQVGGEVAIQQRLQLDLLVGGDIDHHFDSGLVNASLQHPFPEIEIAAAAMWTCREDDLALVAVPLSSPPCYANCDGSTIPPVLNVNDFVCFQTRYAAGDASANCDGSTVQPVLNVNDFVCFQSRFAAGCP